VLPSLNKTSTNKTEGTDFSWQTFENAYAVNSVDPTTPSHYCSYNSVLYVLSTYKQCSTRWVGLISHRSHPQWLLSHHRGGNHTGSNKHIKCARAALIINYLPLICSSLVLNPLTGLMFPLWPQWCVTWSVQCASVTCH